MKSYPSKLVNERRFATMDFTSQLAQIGTGVTLVSCVASIAVYQGTDANPSNILDGGTSIQADVAGQWLKAGVTGVYYTVTWTATCSDGSALIRQRILPIVANWP